ncbi:MAG TPA: TraR/DksA C4-type zinc finger protein [bacterium]|nr:TraR/DksA C4-type zinc finger protein [bacterium]HPR89467.1 TraR/DksA C4-type zinc finger protein [bacterium]
MAINRQQRATAIMQNMVKPLTPFNEEELEYFQQLILKRKTAALEEIERLEKYLASDTSEGSTDSAYSYHMADAGTDTMHLDNVYIQIERQKTLIGYLDRALERIKNKTYGICRVTGTPIPRERLEAIPHTEISVAAKMQENKR